MPGGMSGMLHIESEERLLGHSSVEPSVGLARAVGDNSLHSQDGPRGDAVDITIEELLLLFVPPTDCGLDAALVRGCSWLRALL